MPDRPLLADTPRMQATARVLRLVYRDAVAAQSIVDLGCLEGGYTVEFARMGMRSTGIEVRQSNYANCMLVKNKVQLPNLEFHNDDVLTSAAMAFSSSRSAAACYTTWIVLRNSSGSWPVR